MRRSVFAVAHTRWLLTGSAAHALLKSTGFPPFYKSVVSFSECLYEWSGGEFQLPTRDGIEFLPDRVVMHQFAVPGVVREFHVIGNGICETGALLGVLFRKGFVDDCFEVYAKV